MRYTELHNALWTPNLAYHTETNKKLTTKNWNKCCQRRRTLPLAPRTVHWPAKLWSTMIFRCRFWPNLANCNGVLTDYRRVDISKILLIYGVCPSLIKLIVIIISQISMYRYRMGTINIGFLIHQCCMDDKWNNGNFAIFYHLIC